MRCVVPNCPTVSGLGVPQFTFPADKTRRTKWLAALRIDESQLRKSSVICALHFPSSHVYQTSSRMLLRDWAVPRFEPYGSDEDDLSLDISSSPIKTSPELSQPIYSSTQNYSEPATGEASVSSALAPISQGSSGSGLLSESFSTPESPFDPDYVEHSPKRQKFEAGEEKGNFLASDGSRVYLVSEVQLRQLFQRCLSCGERVERDAAIYSLGVDIRVELYCSGCSTGKWYSFAKEAAPLNEGNSRLVAATIVSGNTFEDINSVANNFNLQMMSSSTFHRFASRYVYPAVDEAYLEQHKRLMTDLKDIQLQDEQSALKLAMDGRFSRPGFTATFGVVSALDVETGKVLDAHVLKKNDEEISSSPQMEIVGVRRLVESLLQPCTDRGDQDDAGPSTSGMGDSLRISDVVTDDSTSLIKMMRSEFPTIDHGGDSWHLLKSIRKRLLAVAHRASCRELQFWIKSIDNFLWTCIKNCNGDGDLLIEQWRSMPFHIIGQHEWLDDETFKTFRRCAHAMDNSSREVQYLLPHTAAHNALLEMVNDPKLQARIRRCHKFMQTSEVESYHSVMLKYVPKRLHFGDQAFKSRVKLAVIDWNNRVRIGPRLRFDGTPMYQVSVPPSAADWRAKPRTSLQSYEWSKRLVSRIWGRAQDLSRIGEIPDGRSVLVERPLVEKYGSPNRGALIESYCRRHIRKS